MCIYKINVSANMKKEVEEEEVVRVTSLDLHPTEPWILITLSSGIVHIMDHQSTDWVMVFQVAKFPVLTAKFIARKQWIVTGSNMFIRVYNYTTKEKVMKIEAHRGYIRSVAVHPTLPYVLSSSDDMLIKLWDWEKGWKCTLIFRGHSHSVMQVTFNPKITKSFASASLDRTIKIWNLVSPEPKFTFDGHLQGVNCVDYYSCDNKQYLITGSNDFTAKVWDYKTKSCVQTLEGHTCNVSVVCFHPEFPIVITGSEDGMLCIWDPTTYRLVNTVHQDLGQICAMGCLKGTRRVIIGSDSIIWVKLGPEKPVASMYSSGKIIWAKRKNIQIVCVKTTGGDFEVTDGERLPLTVKKLGKCDMYPMSLKHDPNGKYFSVCGEGEYIIYSTLGRICMSFGPALEFVWSSDGGYAVRQSTSEILMFSELFQDKRRITLSPIFPAKRIFGGPLLAICSEENIFFFDWARFTLIHTICGNAKDIFWADSGDLVTIACDASFSIHKYKRDRVSSYLESGALNEEGVEDAFELLHVIHEQIRTGIWASDYFIYINSSWGLNFSVGCEATTMFHFDHPVYLLGYLASQNRVYLIDKQFNIIRHTLPLNSIEYKTLVMDGDQDRANKIFPSIPEEEYNSVARFMESQGMLEDALRVATDPTYMAYLALRLVGLKIAEVSLLVGALWIVCKVMPAVP